MKLPLSETPKTGFLGARPIYPLFMISVFCDIPDLMTHLQNNYQYWKEEEENPSVDYDLAHKGQSKGQGQTKNPSKNNNGTNNKTVSETENESGEKT